MYMLGLILAGVGGAIAGWMSNSISMFGILAIAVSLGYLGGYIIGHR